MMSQRDCLTLAGVALFKAIVRIVSGLATFIVNI